MNAFKCLLMQFDWYLSDNVEVLKITIKCVFLCILFLESVYHLIAYSRNFLSLFVNRCLEYKDCKKQEQTESTSPRLGHVKHPCLEYAHTRHVSTTSASAAFITEKIINMLTSFLGVFLGIHTALRYPRWNFSIIHLKHLFVQSPRLPRCYVKVVDSSWWHGV